MAQHLLDDLRWDPGLKLGNGTLVPIAEDVATTNGHRGSSWTAAELLETDFPSARFAIPDLIPEGLTFFAGAPKLGKSWMALGWALAVASGGRALGSIQVEQGDVLYLALEDSPRRLKERLEIVLEGDAPPAGLTFVTDWPRLGAGGAERIGEWTGDHTNARLIVVDVFTRMRAADLRRADLYRADYDGARCHRHHDQEHGSRTLHRDASSRDAGRGPSGGSA